MNMTRMRWMWPLLLVTGLGWTVILGVALRDLYELAKQDLIAQLEHEAILIERLMGPIRSFEESPDRQLALHEALNSVSIRLGESLQVFTPTGQRWASTLTSPNAMVALNRHEVKTAIQGHVGVAIRQNRVSQERVLYVVSPIILDGEVGALIELGVSMRRIHQAVWTHAIRWGGVGLGLWVLMGLLMWWRSRQMGGAIDDLKQAVDQAVPTHRHWGIPEPEWEMLKPLQESLQTNIRSLLSQVVDLREQYAQQQVMLDHLSDGLMVIDRNEIIRLSNQNASRFLQIVAPLEGQSISSQVRNSQFMTLIRRGLQGMYQRGLVVFRDREDRYFEVDAIPIPIAQSGHVIVMIRDITESIELDLAQHQLIVNVSNRIKGPISRLDDALLPLVPPDLGVAQAAIKSVRTIVADLMYLTRLRHSLTMQQWVTLDERLDGICQDVVDILKSTADDKGVQFDCQFSPVVAKLNGAAVSQAVIQLLKNAILYSLAGGKVRVMVDERPDPTLVIQDFGIGIPTESLPYVFDPFFRINTPKHESVDGGGLGLAIVKTIVDAHGGSIEVTSEWGQGTVVTLTFPPQKGGSHVVSNE